MRQIDETKYVKRTQKDYTYSFKLQVVQEVEQGELGIKAAQRKYGIQGDGTVRKWLEKHGNFDLENKAMLPMPKSTEAKLLELEQKVKLLEKQKKRLEYQVEQAAARVFPDLPPGRGIWRRHPSLPVWPCPHNR